MIRQWTHRMLVAVAAVVILAAGCVTQNLVAEKVQSSESYIRNYVFLHLSDQRPTLQGVPEIEISVIDSNDNLRITLPDAPVVPTPGKLTVGGIPFERYRRERQGKRMIFIDPAAFPETNHAFLFPSGGFPHWFSLTIEERTGKVNSHFQPSSM